MFEISQNKKADLLVRIMGLISFKKGWEMHRVEGKDIPEELKSCDLVYKCMGNPYLKYVGFKDETETVYTIDRRGDVDEDSYTQALIELNVPKEEVEKL